MRTSTAVFLMIFLCLASSNDRRSRVREFVSDVRSTIREFVADNRESWHGERWHHAAPIADSPRIVELKNEIRTIDGKQVAANKAIRAIDRSIRELKDRVSEIRRDPCSKRNSSVFETSVDLLTRQIGELEAEKAQLRALADSLDNNRVQVKSALELESVRAERHEIEKLLERGNSPIDRLAGTAVYTSR